MNNLVNQHPHYLFSLSSRQTPPQISLEIHKIAFVVNEVFLRLPDKSQTLFCRFGPELHHDFKSCRKLFVIFINRAFLLVLWITGIGSSTHWRRVIHKDADFCTAVASMFTCQIFATTDASLWTTKRRDSSPTMTKPNCDFVVLVLSWKWLEIFLRLLYFQNAASHRDAILLWSDPSFALELAQP